MAGIWGSENIVADHRDLQANTMAVDKNGQFVILAGRRHMGIINLDNPGAVVHKTNRHSKWDVTTAEWNPHQNEYFALACNQRTEIYSWHQGNVLQITSLKAHTRSISDQNWSNFDVNTLATASIDTFIYLWDIRDPRKPTMFLSAVAGASQVKWNKFKNHMIATSHEGDIRLWDTRKGTSPVKYITAHLMKIHNIDWCPFEENILATSSQDCTVKFWDVTVPSKIDDNLQVPCPVWRAQYTPFGYGLVTVVVPPLRRGDNSLLLWNMRNTSNPVHTFFGHSDVVVEFGWRKPSEDTKDYHLITFAKDHCLRTWAVDVQMQKACDHRIPGDDDVLLDSLDSFSFASVRDIEPTVQNSPPSTPAKMKERIVEVTPKASTPAQPQNLQQEFSLVNLNIPNLTINEMDASKRSCTVTALSGKYIVFLKLSFPTTYPNNNPPSFQFCDNTTIDEEMKAKILKVLKKVSLQQVRRNRSCLEPCLRQLVTTLNNLTAEDKDFPIPESSFYVPSSQQSYVPASHYTYSEDVSCPFPRTSGARFCGADLLVVFTRPHHLHHINAPTDNTPRSLSALSAYLASHVVLPIKGRTTSSSPGQYSFVYQPVAQSPSGEASVSISSFYQQDRKLKKHRDLQERRSSGPKQLSNSGAVLIYSISKLLPLNYNLAQNYVFDTSDIAGTCSKNAAAAAKEGLKDLVQVWSIAGLIYSASIVRVPKQEYPVPWSKHPFGQDMLMSLILHYGSHYDVQTAAMLACIFHEKSNEVHVKKTTDIGLGGNISAGGSPYHTVVPADNTFEGWNLVETEAAKRNRSNSWSQEDGFFDDFDKYNEMVREEEREFLQANSNLLNSAYTAQFDNYKTVYADVLYRWNLLEQRAQILKTISVHPKPHTGVEFLTECQHCQNDGRSVQCQTCKKFSFVCVICGIAVKGCSSFCMICGHGGHTKHIEEWFSDMDVCPSGCGCRCVDYMLF